MKVTAEDILTLIREGYIVDAAFDSVTEEGIAALAGIGFFQERKKERIPGAVASQNTIVFNGICDINNLEYVNAVAGLKILSRTMAILPLRTKLYLPKNYYAKFVPDSALIMSYLAYVGGEECGNLSVMSGVGVPLYNVSSTTDVVLHAGTPIGRISIHKRY